MYIPKSCNLQLMDSLSWFISIRIGLRYHIRIGTGSRKDASIFGFKTLCGDSDLLKLSLFTI